MKTDYLEQYTSLNEDVVLFLKLCSQRATRWLNADYIQELGARVASTDELIDKVLNELEDNLADTTNPEGIFERYKERLNSYMCPVTKKGITMALDAFVPLGVKEKVSGILNDYNEGIKTLSKSIKDLRIKHNIKAIERFKGKSLITMSPEAKERFKTYFKASFTRINTDGVSYFDNNLMADLMQQHTLKDLATLALAIYNADVIKTDTKNQMSFAEWLREFAEIWQTPPIKYKPTQLQPNYSRYYYLIPKK